MQKEFIFFEDDPLSEEERKAFLDPSREGSPYYGFIGNYHAVKRLIRLDFTALGRPNHRCNDLNIALIGRPGCGKTELVRRHVKANGLPLVDLHPRSIRKMHDLFERIKEVCDKADIPLEEMNDYNQYYIPPVNVFIDEVHSLSDYIVQGLLKATEQKDRVFYTEQGTRVDCKFIHWIIATTECGKLFDAFDSRFMKIKLNVYNHEELSTIIKINFPEWEEKVCRLVAHFCSRLPREALAFAQEMQLEKTMNPVSSWEEIAYQVAQDNEIDRHGMSQPRLNVLKILAQGPVAAKRLPAMLGIKIEELENRILPWLLESPEDEEPLIGVTNRGYIITESGKKELKKRGLS